MKRILIIYNPRSSRYSDVKNEVLSRLTDLNGFMVGKYEVEKGNVDDNAKKLLRLLKDDDLVVAAGGDATAVIAVNAIMESNKDVKLAVLPYGNFNDLSRTLGISEFEQIFSNDVHEGKLYPLEIIVNDRHFRFASCYTTIGMMAEAVKLYDSPKMRKILKSSFGRKIGSYTNLAGWYFKNRHKKVFIPEFKLNGELMPKKISDYAAINGRFMARIMKGGEDYKKPVVFRSKTDKLTSFWRLFKLMIKSIFLRIPGDDTRGDVLEFLEPATVEVQAEGEYKTFKGIHKIEIRKSKKCLKVIEI